MILYNNIRSPQRSVRGFVRGSWLRFVVVATSFGIATWACLAMITTPEHWWRSVDPLGYASRHLVDQPVFALPHLSHEGRRDPASEYWQQIARAPARAADSIFAEVLRTGTPASRLYALAWFADKEANRFRAFAETLRISVDTAWVQVSCSDDHLQSLAVADAVSAIEWRARRAFLASDSTCGMIDGFIW